MRLKLFLGILLFTTVYSIFPGKTHAQFANPNYLNTNSDVPQNINTHTQAIFINIATTLSCILSGVDPINPDKPCLGIDPETKKIGYVESGSGAIGIVGGLIASTFYIPVNTHDYGSYMAGNFGIAKPTYAQGVGFNGLKPTLKLWQAFRNMTYMIFVILFLIIGIGIMFRIKIDPRTVMTLQNQIPKIIIAIVLITFSYAIAGFLIDLMYVSMYILISIFVQEGISPANITASSPFGAIGGVGGLSGIAKGVAETISGIVASIFDGTLGQILSAIIGGIVGGFLGNSFGGPIGSFLKVGGLVGSLVGGIGGALLGSKLIGLLAGVIAYLVIIIALFSALLRLWFTLIKCYIYILINVVLAPFIIASGLIPGRSGFGTWIRSILSNIVVFPVTIAMLLLGKAFIEGFSKGTPGEPPFVPPFVGDFSSPERFASIIGLAIILMLPEVANMAREALKSPELKYSAAIGKGLGVGAGVIGAPVAGIGKRYVGINPYTNEPRYLTRALINRFGRGSNIIGRTLRGITGTGSWFSRTPEGVAQEAERQRVAFNRGRRATRPEGGTVEGPELPPRRP